MGITGSTWSMIIKYILLTSKWAEFFYQPSFIKSATAQVKFEKSNINFWLKISLFQARKQKETSFTVGKVLQKVEERGHWHCKYVFFELLTVFQSKLNKVLCGWCYINKIHISQFIVKFFSDIKLWAFFGKNVKKKHLCRHDKNYYYSCKSSIS